METSRSVFAKLSANYTTVYIYLGVMTPFWAIWLKYKELSPSEIGIIIAIPYFIKLIVAPAISQVSDKRGEYRRPLILCVTSSLISASLYFFVDEFWQLMMVTILVNLTLPAVMPLMETITVAQTTKHNLLYGRIRSFGSISFIFAAVTLGWFIKGMGQNVILPFAFISLFLILLTVVLLPGGNKEYISDDENASGSPIIALLQNNEFVWFLVIVGLIQASHGVYYSMGSIYWQEHGFEEHVIGLLWAVGVIAEILFFIYCGNFIRKFPVMLIFALIGFLGTIRWLLFSITLSLPIIVFSQMIHALTFGASHLVAIQYIGNSISKKHAGTAQSLYSSIPLGIVMGAATYLGGILYEYESGRAYIAMSVMCFIAFLISMIRIRRQK